MMMQQKLEEKEARLQAILDTAVDGIITIDWEGIILSFNRAAERVFGYRMDEVVGRNIKVLMPEPDRSAHAGYLANYHRSGVPKIIGIGREVVGLRKNGTRFPIDLAISEVRLSSGIIFTGMVRDITRRKKAEEGLSKANLALDRQNKALEKKNWELERFNKLFVDRELRIKALKAQVKAFELSKNKDHQYEND